MTSTVNNLEDVWPKKAPVDLFGTGIGVQRQPFVDRGVEKILGQESASAERKAKQQDESARNV